MTTPERKPGDGPAGLHTTDSELLREAAQDASQGEITKEAGPGGPHYSRDIAQGRLTPAEVDAAYPPSEREYPVPARPVNAPASAGGVSMDTPLGEELLAGHFSNEEGGQSGAAQRAERPKERFVVVTPQGERVQPRGGMLEALRGRVREGTRELQDRGSQLAFTAKLKLELRQHENDQVALFTRLGRAYHRRAEPAVLNLIEAEINRVEREIQICRDQLDAQSENIAREKSRRQHAEMEVNYPAADAETGDAFGLRAKPPRIEHTIATKPRDTFFGLDQGGVDQQVTVTGGNAAFNTQRDNPHEGELTIDDVIEAEDNGETQR